MGMFSFITKPLKKVVSGVGNIVSDVVDAGVGLVNDIPVVGKIADDVLGLDPSGKGIVPIVKTVGTAAALGGLGSAVGGLFTGAGGAAAADSAFIAADAAQLAAQGIGEAQIASTLASSGVSAGAANLAASMAANGISQSVINQQLANLSSNTGLFTQSSDAASLAEMNAADAAQLAKQTGNNVAAIEQNLIAAGIDPLEAASLAQNAVLASGAIPSKSMWDEFTNYLQKNPDLLNLLGKAGAVGLASNVTAPAVQQVPAYQPLNNMPVYDPAYYQQIQNYYTGYMPNMPRDVATPLQQWYSQGYIGPDEATKNAFGG